MPTGEPRRSAPMLVIPHSQEEGSMMRTRLLKMPRCVQMSVFPLLSDCDSWFQEAGSIRGGPILSPLCACVCADTAQIGLPQDKSKLPLLCILDPFIAGNEVLVTPCALFLPPDFLNAPDTHLVSHTHHSVVVLILDNTLKVRLSFPQPIFSSRLSPLQLLPSQY